MKADKKKDPGAPKRPPSELMDESLNDDPLTDSSYHDSDTEYEVRDPAETFAAASQFLLGLSSNPTLIRNVAVVGHLHHGKTCFLDMLVEQTQHISTFDQNSENRMKYLDTRVDEHDRKISIKAVPMSLVLQDSNSNSYTCNIIDTPGHVDFSDEMTAALRLADGAVLVIDAAEGVMLNTVRAIRHAIQDNLPIVVVINKVDRLINELKLPPKEVYRRLRSTIDVINDHITAMSTDIKAQLINPADGNVCFASGIGGWCFTLQSFAKLYVQLHCISYDANEFASKLWGNYWYETATTTFKHEQPSKEVERSFVQLILKPLCNIYSQVVDENTKSVETKRAQLSLACRSDFGSATSFTNMLVYNIPSAKEAAARKLEHTFSGPKDKRIYIAMEECDPFGPLMVNITKLYPKADSSRFDAFGRVYSGQIRSGQLVVVLDEFNSPNDLHLCAREVSKLWVYHVREKIPINKALPGSWVLIEGVDDTILKTATLCDLEYYEEKFKFMPLQYNTLAVVKTTIEALNPSDSDIAELRNNISKICKSYPLAVNDYDENLEEHTIIGTGRMYIDCMVKDIRELSANIEFKVSDLYVSFFETVASSSMNCVAETPDKKNGITMVAEPLEAGMAEDIENGFVSVYWPRKELRKTKYDWDRLDGKSIWSFGEDKHVPNILLGNTLSNEVDKSLLNIVKDSIVIGLQRGARAGPICHEPISNVMFTVLDIRNAQNYPQSSFIQLAERVSHSAFLDATPQLLEPVSYIEIQTPQNWVSDITKMLTQRRAMNIKHENSVKAFLPIIESFAFEKHLQDHTKGEAFFSISAFSHLAIVPGNPLKSAPDHNLAYEFVEKTKRREEQGAFT